MEAGKKEDNAEGDGDDVRVGNDAGKEFAGDATTEEIDAVGKEGDVESDNKAAVGDDASGAEGAGDNGVAKEGGVVEDEGKLGFEADFALIEVFVKDEARGNNEGEHDNNAAGEASEEKVGGSDIKVGGKGEE